MQVVRNRGKKTTIAVSKTTNETVKEFAYYSMVIQSLPLAILKTGAYYPCVYFSSGEKFTEIVSKHILLNRKWPLQLEDFWCLLVTWLYRNLLMCSYIERVFYS